MYFILPVTLILHTAEGIYISERIFEKRFIENKTDYLSVQEYKSRTHCTVRCADHTKCGGIEIKDGMCYLMENATKPDCEGNTNQIAYYGKSRFTI